MTNPERHEPTLKITTMTHDLVKKITQNCGWKFDRSGGGLPYVFKKGNFYLFFDCQDSHDLGTAKNVALKVQMFFDELEYKKIIDSEMPNDMIAFKGLIQYYTDLIKN